MFLLLECIRIGSMRIGIIMRVVPLMRSIQDPTLIFSDDFIILRASSRRTSPVNRSSMTSISRSANSNRRRELSFCIDILPLKANSNKIHPRNVYEILSFQNDKYPYHITPNLMGGFETCLSFNPRRRTSSIKVSLGNFRRSSPSSMSRGSNAIL